MAPQRQGWSSSLTSTPMILVTMAYFPHFTLLSTQHSRCSANGIIPIMHTWECLLKCYAPCQCPPKMTDPRSRPITCLMYQLREQVPTARARMVLTLFQCKKCTVCGHHLGSFPKLILLSQLWNILFFQFQNLLMLKKKEREIQSAHLRFAKTSNASSIEP